MTAPERKAPMFRLHGEHSDWRLQTQRLLQDGVDVAEVFQVPERDHGTLAYRVHFGPCLLQGGRVAEQIVKSEGKKPRCRLVTCRFSSVAGSLRSTVESYRQSGK